MTARTRRLAAFLCAMLLFHTLPFTASAVEDPLSESLSTAAEYVLAAAAAPGVGSIGGEWAVFGLVRSGCPLPDGYASGYLERVTETVRTRKGVLHKSRYTEYARVVLALTALGQDPADVAGYDLLAPLSDFDAASRQGINGMIYALLALDCGGYDSPAREPYLAALLACQLPDGGWSLTSTSDIDLTAMALQALAKYRDRPAVETAVQRGLAYLAAQQDETGGFGSAESTAQVLVALCELEIDLEHTLKVGDRSVLDGLLRFQLPDGSFAHQYGLSGSLMSSEQALYALAAAKRFREGSSSLYRIRHGSQTGTEAARSAIPAAAAAATATVFCLPGMPLFVLPALTHSMLSTVQGGNLSCK